MKKILISFFTVLSITAFAQTKVSVTVQNGSFTPQAFTINQGDTIEWNNIQGFHFVDGTLTTFPTNPEGFGNPANGGAPWTYSYVFNTPGNYAYRCGIHTTTMFGGFTVNTSTSVKEVKALTETAYPNPTSGIIYFPSATNYSKIELYNHIGQLMLSKTNPSGSIDLSEYEKGTYFLKVYEDNHVTSQKVIVQ